MKYGIIALIFLTSCAALGSRTKISDKARICTIKTVGLVTSAKVNSTPDERFIDNFVGELKKRDLFDVVLLGTRDNRKLSTLMYETDAPVDALMVIERKITSHKSSLDVTLRVRLIDLETKETLLLSKHGTFLGNSYWASPSLNTTERDAIAGALNTFEKHIKRVRKEICPTDENTIPAPANGPYTK